MSRSANILIIFLYLQAENTQCLTVPMPPPPHLYNFILCKCLWITMEDIDGLHSPSQFYTNYSLDRQREVFVFLPGHVKLPGFIKTFGRRKGFPTGLLLLFLLFLYNSGNITCHFPGCVGVKLASPWFLSYPSSSNVAVSGHRVKIEDTQKMQFSDRLSEIERYQRSMRIGPVNNNPRPIHQTHLSTTQGEDHWYIQSQPTNIPITH